MSRKGKRNWTEDMNRAVLECKRKAQESLLKDCPTKQNGRKKGYIQIMKELWDDMGYGYLGFTGQNLRDQASRLEKIQDSIFSTQNREENINQLEINDGEYATTHPRPALSLHNNSISQYPEDSLVNEEISTRKIQPNLPSCEVFPSACGAKQWGSLSHEQFCATINDIYDEIQKKYI
ncbi:uncharacterized protein LOC110249894 [Exaiptasia diaphana]|uniref:Uncharacterized protein n=1 Tax=Exaiptasia diaphana TaxID=2652724 RepID=A0A913XY56_EXADI|nr:uncharacterized protein LOC110249894 [Exaiptasia diaphana]